MAFVGGLGYVLVAIFSFFLTPCAAYSFRMRALKRLYFARTSDLGIFELDRNSSSQSGQLLHDHEQKGLYSNENWNKVDATQFSLDSKLPRKSSTYDGNAKNEKTRPYVEEIKDELLKHNLIRLKSGAWADLFCGCSSSEKIKKLYKIGNEKLNDETNMVAIVKKLRHFEIILENSLLNSD